MQQNTAATRKLIFNSEGGFVVDNGGPTMKGVTLATARAYFQDPTYSVEQLKRISDDDAWAIYANKYLRTVRFDELPSGLDYAMADFSVNSGPAQANKTLQGIVGTARDGIMGINTLAAAKSYPDGPVALIDDLMDARLAFMQGLSVWSTYGKGWTNRIASVRANAKRMHAAPLAPASQPVSKPGPGAALPAGTKISATPHGKSNIIAGLGTVITAGASAAPNVAQWASDGRDKLQPFADHYPKLHFAMEVLFGIGLVATIVGVIVGFAITSRNIQQGNPV